MITSVVFILLPFWCKNLLKILFVLQICICLEKFSFSSEALLSKEKILHFLLLFDNLEHIVRALANDASHFASAHYHANSHSYICGRRGVAAYLREVLALIGAAGVYLQHWGLALASAQHNALNVLLRFILFSKGL